MKIASFELGGKATYGIVDGDGVRPAADGFRGRYPDLRSAIADRALGELEGSVLDTIAIDRIRFDVPIPNPGKIACVGMNYRAHTAELKREQPDAPSLFTRFPDSVVGHGGEIIRPSVSEQHDFEGELAVIIGRTAHRARADDALDYVAGYSCFLDGSVRAVPLRALWKLKWHPSFDTNGPYTRPDYTWPQWMRKFGDEY